MSFPRLFHLRNLPGARYPSFMDSKFSRQAEAPPRRAVKRKGTPEAQHAAAQAAAASRVAAEFIAQHSLVRPRIWVDANVLHIDAYDVHGKKVSVRERLRLGGPGDRWLPVSPLKGLRATSNRPPLAMRWLKNLVQAGMSYRLADDGELQAQQVEGGKDIQAKPEAPPSAEPVLESHRKAPVRSVPLEQFMPANRMAPDDPAASRGSPAELSRANAAATDRAQRSGHAYLLSLIDDGSLLGSSDLAQAWGVTPQALRQLADADELVAIKVNNKLRYPVELVRFDARSDAQRVSHCLAKLPAIERVMFMLNEHAELGGKTVSEAFRAGQGARALALANRAAEAE